MGIIFENKSLKRKLIFMKLLKSFVVVVGLLGLLCSKALLAQNLEPKLKAKVETNIKSEFGVVSYDILKLFSIEPKESNDLNTLFSIKSNIAQHGYIYIGRANSMKDKFDYIIIFDKTWTVKKVKVLIYREQHGRQIGEARWLAQFVGFKLSDRPKIGVEIDGITGATISATSLTSDISKVLETLAKNKQKGILK
jgi:Na+-translocating ferredoxin:NAD+ oxidoreductase RnfG subunit